MHSQARGLGSKRQSFDWLHIAPPTLPRKTTLRIINSPNSKSRLETPFDNAKSEVEDVQKLRELDDTLVYEFQDHERVWVKTEDDDWIQAVIVPNKTTRIMKTRVCYAKFYQVAIGQERKWLSPLNGDIKPDAQRVRDLLKKDGYLQEEEAG